MEQLKNPKLFWAFWGAVAASWQAHAMTNHNGATGSETTRSLWMTHTKPGKVAFIAAYAAFTAWFPLHILKKVESVLEDKVPEDNG